MLYKPNGNSKSISLVPSALSDMLSLNQQGANSTFDMSFDNVHPEPWDTTHQIWVQDSVPVNNERQVQQYPSGQQTWQPQVFGGQSQWGQHLLPHNYQSYGYPGNVYAVNQYSNTKFPINQASQQPVSTQHIISKNQTKFQRIRAKPHQAKISLVPSSSGGFKAIVKRKRKRTMFTTEQIEALETVFRSKQYITRDERQILVDQLQVSDSAVKVWFQNRRLKGKREYGHEQASVESKYENEDSSCSSSNSARLDDIESELYQKTDEHGYVKLDDKAIGEIVNIIDSVLTEVDLNLGSHDAEDTTADSDASTYAGSIYEPISPAVSNSTDEEAPRWKPLGAEQSLQRLFDLHFC